MALFPVSAPTPAGDVWEEFQDSWDGAALLSSELPVAAFEICKKICGLQGYRGFSFGGRKAYFIRMDTSMELCVEALEEGSNTSVYTVLQGQAGWETFRGKWCSLVDWTLPSVDSWNLVPVLKKICILQESRGLCLRGGSAYFIPADASVQDCREAIAPSSRFPGGLYVVANIVYLRV